MQLVLGVLLLHQFAPAAVGEFSVVAQIAFYWMTLALAQGQLKLLADHGLPARAALRENMRAALGRWALLLPLGWIAVRLSGTTVPGAWLWATALALLQLGWALAQPLTLRLGDTRKMVWIRIAPPAVTLSIVAVAAIMWPNAGASTLLLAAAAGYAWGWRWLLPTRSGETAVVHPTPPLSGADRQRDDRRASLRVLHAAADAVAGTAILLVWQRVYGAAEAGYLAILLRILGFMPAVTHAAWAQVLLAQALPRRQASLRAGALGGAVTGLLGLACLVALWLAWINPAWQGLAPYVLPVVCWQASACALAAFSHLPFQTGRASAFSRAAIGYDVLQLAFLCLPPLLGLSWSPGGHIAVVAYCSSLGLLGLCLWLLRGLRGP